MLQNIE